MSNSANKKIKNDVILALSLIAFALVLFLIFKISAKEGSVVKITLGGEHYATLPLSEDAELEVINGDNINVVTVRDGEVYVSRASCPDKICEEHRAIRYSGETIVCLPNKVVVSIEGEGSLGDVDTAS